AVAGPVADSPAGTLAAGVPVAGQALPIEPAKTLTPTDALGQQFVKALPTLGTGEVIRSVPQSTKTSVSSSIASGVVAPIALQATPTETAYEWDFGDGTTAQTTTPSVTHDYFPAIGGSDVARSFDVTC